MAFPVPAGLQTDVSLVPDNLVAFALRALSARAAAQTLDLQYYVWDEDVTGRLLIREVLRAADRGVRVRLLLDDLYVRRTERALATLAQHPRIEVRLYNPFQLRSWGLLGAAVEFLFAGYRLNHRMHNKAWIVDGRLVIGGGRNVGDEYFDASSQFNFRDLDLVVAGRATSQVLTLFDRYWTDRRVRPIDQVAASRPVGGGLDSIRRKLDVVASSASAPAYLERLRALPNLAELLKANRTVLGSDKVRFVADPPGKGLGRRRSPGMLEAVRGALRPARKRVVLISPLLRAGPARDADADHASPPRSVSLGLDELPGGHGRACSPRRLCTLPPPAAPGRDRTARTQARRTTRAKPFRLRGRQLAHKSVRGG